MKDLTPEELSVLTNMQSQIGQILSMAGGTGAGQAGVAAGPSGTVQMGDPSSDSGVTHGSWVGPIHKPGSSAPSKVEGEEEEEEDDDQDEGAPGSIQGAPANVAKPVSSIVKGKLKKAIIVGDPDASTASGEADERIEDLPEWDEENLDQVVKAILRMATGKGVMKSARPQNPLVVALAQVTKAMSVIAEQQSIHGKVLEDLLDGLGVTKGLDEAKTRATRSRPVGTMPQDNANVAKEFINALASVMKSGGGNGSVVTGEDAGLTPTEIVRKNMGSLALAMSQVAGDQWNPNLAKGE